MNEQTEQQNDSVLNQILHETAKSVESRVKQLKPDGISINVLVTGIRVSEGEHEVASSFFGYANDAFMDKKNIALHMLDTMFTEQLKGFGKAFFVGPVYKLLKHITGIAGKAVAVVNAAYNTTESTESTEDKE